MNREKALLRCGISLVAASTVLFGVSAFAQTASTTGPQGQPGQPTTRSERPDQQRAPAAMAAENYDPKGVRVGSFRLFPELELDEVYNDNIYAANTGKVGSFIQLIKPTLDLRSDWSRHMLNMYAKGAFGLYSVDNANNYYDYSAGFDGRVDIQKDWNVYGGGAFAARHEDRGTPQSINPTIEPNKYNQVIGNLGYFQKFNRLSARVDGRFDNYHYTNQGLGPTSGSIFNSDRNRSEFRESVRVGYEFSPGFEVWTRGSLNQKRYDTGVDSLGFAHNSSGYDVVGGVALDFGGITSVEAFAGYMQQDYVDARYPKLSGAMFGVAAYWNPIRELWVKPFLRRTIEDSSLTTSSGYINTAGGVDVDYRMRPNIRLDAHGDYAVADYNAIAGSSQRYDQYLTLKAGLQYLFTENFYAGPAYQFLHRWSNQTGSDYDQNVFMLRLGARL